MHESGETHERRRDLSGDEVIGEVEDGEVAEVPDIGGDRAGDPVTDEVEEAEGGEMGRDAGRDLAGDSFPIGEDEGGEGGKRADLRGDRTRHEGGGGGGGRSNGRIFGVEAEVDDAAGGGVAADAEPVLVAAIATGPGIEDAEDTVGLEVEGGLEGE